METNILRLAKAVALSEANLPTHSHAAGTLVTDTSLTRFSVNGTVTAQGDNGREDCWTQIELSNVFQSDATYAGGSANAWYATYKYAHAHNISGSTAATGSGEAFSIMPPYYIVYMWIRVE